MPLIGNATCPDVHDGQPVADAEEISWMLMFVTKPEQAWGNLPSVAEVLHQGGCLMWLQEGAEHEGGAASTRVQYLRCSRWHCSHTIGARQLLQVALRCNAVSRLPGGCQMLMEVLFTFQSVTDTSMVT